MTGKRSFPALRVEPGAPADLAGRDPGDRLGYGGKAEGLDRLAVHAARIGELHDLLWAEARRSVLLVLQGLDASGKDGTLKRILSGVNPQGCRVVSFKEPTTTDLAHDYLWRIHAACPARGELGSFNRSHYEDVTVVRVHGLVPQEVWQKRYRHIREFERMLTDEGTTVLKVFLNMSKAKQAERLQERLDNPAKAWKFRRSDLADRALWDANIAAYEEAITETSTDWAPWHIVPADRNWVRNTAVAELLAHTLAGLDPRLPAPEPGLEQIEIT